MAVGFSEQARLATTPMIEHHCRSNLRVCSRRLQPARCLTMGYSLRKYLLAADDTICRLENMEFDRMLSNPARYRVPGMAGQRIRMADLAVLLERRKPIYVVRATYSLVSFDAQGRLVGDTFLRQQLALAESALAPVFAGPDVDARVVDASSRFVAQGGRWMPSAQLARAIDDVALGRLKCPRLGLATDEPTSRG